MLLEPGQLDGGSSTFTIACEPSSNTLQPRCGQSPSSNPGRIYAAAQIAHEIKVEHRSGASTCRQLLHPVSSSFFISTFSTDRRSCPPAQKKLLKMTLCTAQHCAVWSRAFPLREPLRSTPCSASTSGSTVMMK